MNVPLVAIFVSLMPNALISSHHIHVSVSLVLPVQGLSNVKTLMNVPMKIQTIVMPWQLVPIPLVRTHVNVLMVLTVMVSTPANLIFAMFVLPWQIVLMTSAFAHLVLLVLVSNVPDQT